MKIFLKLLSLLLIIAIAYFASLNTSQIFHLAMFNKTYDVNFAYVAFGLLSAGIIIGFVWGWAYYISASEKLKEYQRKLEKTSVNAECDNSKVSVLESKIEVLEKALKSALEKNNE